MNQHLHVQAHRGASLEKRENSLESIERALEIGADSIEIDIHLLEDGNLIVFHDFFISAPTGKKRPVCEFNASEMQELGFPTLSEVFELLRKNPCSQLLWLDIEVKYLEKNAKTSTRQRVVDEVLRNVSLNWELSRTKFRSFDWNLLRLFHQMVPTFQTIPLIGKEEGDLKKALELQPEWLAPHVDLCTEKTISWAHGSGVKLMPYTVNSFSQWKKLAEWGIDGITTDDPRGLLQFLGR